MTKQTTNRSGKARTHHPNAFSSSSSSSSPSSSCISLTSYIKDDSNEELSMFSEWYLGNPTHRVRKENKRFEIVADWCLDDGSSSYDEVDIDMD